MVSRGQIRLKKIWAMLEKCAPGYSRKRYTHNWTVTFGDKRYRRLPLGPHGKRDNVEIQIGHVRNLVRHLGIEECAEKEIEQLSRSR